MSRNTTSTSHQVHEAREALGRRLRELRQQAGLTGRQLAESLSWPPSKISKLENGRQTPTDEDIRQWAEGTSASGEAQSLLVSLHTLEEQYHEWRRAFRGGMASHQGRLLELDQKSRFFQVFNSAIIPGLLQTPEYARARFVSASKHLGTPRDIDESVRGRLRRQEALYRPEKRFHFVLTEAALRSRLCSPEVLLGQLDRLSSLAGLPNVKLGIIEFRTRCDTPALHDFWVFDGKQVQIEMFSAELTLKQPQEIELYVKIFEDLAAAASYGRAARALITKVVDELAAEVGDDEDS